MRLTKADDAKQSEASSQTVELLTTDYLDECERAHSDQQNQLDVVHLQTNCICNHVQYTQVMGSLRQVI